MRRNWVIFWSLERKYNVSTPNKSKEITNSSADPKDPLAKKRIKLMHLREMSKDKKSKNLNSIQITRAMTLKKLQMGLPNVFQAMTSFTGAYM